MKESMGGNQVNEMKGKMYTRRSSTGMKEGRNSFLPAASVRRAEHG